MYCILVTGIPAAGKSTAAEFLSDRLNLPMISKDKIKECLFDTVGFTSRDEKVKLGSGSMEIIYYMAGQLMKKGQPFILENNFEHASTEGLRQLLVKYSYTAVTVVLTGDFSAIYQRFLERDKNPGRHRGHVVNDRYPEIEPWGKAGTVLSYESFVEGIHNRGMDNFCANGPCIAVDTTDYSKVDWIGLVEKLHQLTEELVHD